MFMHCESSIFTRTNLAEQMLRKWYLLDSTHIFESDVFMYFRSLSAGYYNKKILASFVFMHPITMSGFLPL